MKVDTTFDLWDNENIIMVKRRHWFVYLLETIPFIVMAIMPLISFVLLVSFFPSALNDIEKYLGFVIFFIAGWLMMTWLMFSVNWTNYYLDLLILTNRRIIDIEQIGLFSRSFSETKLENIQDIEVEVTGVFPSLLKFGDLFVRTAGSKENIVFKDVPDVYKLKESIAVLSHRLLERTGKEQGKAHI